MNRLQTQRPCWMTRAVIGLLFVSLAGFVFATASSGLIFRMITWAGDSTYIDSCIEAVIADVAENKAFIRSAPSPHECGPEQYTMPSGWLGAKADGYLDGAYCGTTGWTYSSSDTHLFGVGAFLCANPSGSQVFHTIAWGTVWAKQSNGTWIYASPMDVVSPNQNY
jgi:hypothetical protein